MGKSEQALSSGKEGMQEQAAWLQQAAQDSALIFKKQRAKKRRYSPVCTSWACKLLLAMQVTKQSTVHVNAFSKYHS